MAQGIGASPGTVDWVERGRELWQRGEAAGAIDAFRRAIAENPRNERAYLELAPRMIGAGRIAELVPILFAAERELPRSVAILTRLRKALILTGRHEEAAAAAERRLALGPDADTLCDLGMAHMQLRRFPEAVEALEKAASMDEGLPNAWMFLGFGYRMTGRPADAIRSFGRVLELDPPASAREAAWGARTALVAQFGDKEAAEEEIGRELAAHPENFSAHCLSAILMQERGRFEAALAALEPALAALEPALPLAHDAARQFMLHTLIGWNQINLARYSEALGALEFAERVGPVEPVSQALLAIACYHLGQNQKVFDAVHKAFETKSSGLGLLDTPQFTSAVFLRLALSLLRLELWEDAGKAARYAIELTPERLEPRMVLHTVLEVQNRYGEAEQVMAEAARLHPELAAGLERLADAHLKAGDRARARDYWDKALRHTSDEAAKTRLRQKIQNGDGPG